MTACARHPWNDVDGALTCTQPADHPGPHIYRASDAPDRHVEPEQEGGR